MQFLSDLNLNVYNHCVDKIRSENRREEELKCCNNYPKQNLVMLNGSSSDTSAGSGVGDLVKTLAWKAGFLMGRNL